MKEVRQVEVVSKEYKEGYIEEYIESLQTEENEYWRSTI